MKGIVVSRHEALEILGHPRLIRPVRAPRIAALPRGSGRMLFDLSRARRDPGLSGEGEGEEYLHVPFTHPADGWQPDGCDTTRRVWCPWSLGEECAIREPWARVPATAWPGLGRQDPDHPRWAAVWAADWDRIALYWRSGATMPLWAARRVVRVTRVVVERLANVTSADLLAAGMRCPEHGDQCRGASSTRPRSPRAGWVGAECEALRAAAPAEWARRWGPPGYPNPWVWRLHLHLEDRATRGAP